MFYLTPKPEPVEQPWEHFLRQRSREKVTFNTPCRNCNKVFGMRVPCASFQSLDEITP